MTTHIVCPSGLAGEIRGLKGKEGKLLSDRAAARAGATFEKILAGCWLATTDPGVYGHSELGGPPSQGKPNRGRAADSDPDALRPIEVVDPETGRTHIEYRPTHGRSAKGES